MTLVTAALGERGLKITKRYPVVECLGKKCKELIPIILGCVACGDDLSINTSLRGMAGSAGKWIVDATTEQW